MKQFITIVCLLLTLSVSAQNRRPNGNPNGNPNASGQFSPAEYAKQQREFFTKNAELTQEEADAFFPIYNELQQKKRELNRETRRIMRQEAGTEPSEEQCLKAIEARAETNIKIAELEKEYLKKFKEVLPASKPQWASTHATTRPRWHRPRRLPSTLTSTSTHSWKQQ